MARVDRPPRGDALDEFLARNELYRKPVAKHTSSLFRVFSEKMFNVQIFHPDVKQRCISHLRDFSETYISYFENRREFESHLIGLESDEIRPGEVEIRALCRLYNATLQIFKEVNANPIVFNEQGAVQIMATRDAVSHFDLVYPIKFLAGAAFCQSVVYNLLYRNVFKMDEEIQIGMQNLHNKSKRGCICDRALNSRADNSSQRLSSVSSGDQEVDLNQDSFENPDASFASSGSPSSGTQSPFNPVVGPVLSSSFSPSPRVEMVCPRHSRERVISHPMPFPFRVAKSLHPEIYRNVEQDTWHDEKKHEEIEATCEIFIKPFMVGDRCLVKLENGQRASAQYYNAHIQEMRSENGPVVVFIEELGDKRELPLKNLQCLPTNQRSFTNRQMKHLKMLRVPSENGPEPLLSSQMMPPPSFLPRNRTSEVRTGSRGFLNSERPILNSCGKPRRDRYGTQFHQRQQQQQLQARFVQPLPLNGIYHPGCILPGGLRGVGDSMTQPIPIPNAERTNFLLLDQNNHCSNRDMPPGFKEKVRPMRSDSISSSDVELKIDIGSLLPSSEGVAPGSYPRALCSGPTPPPQPVSAMAPFQIPMPILPHSTPSPTSPLPAPSPALSFSSEPRDSSTPFAFPHQPFSPFDTQAYEQPQTFYGPSPFPAPPAFFTAPASLSPSPQPPLAMSPQLFGCAPYPPPRPFSPIAILPSPSPDMIGVFPGESQYVLPQGPVSSTFLSHHTAYQSPEHVFPPMVVEVPCSIPGTPQMLPMTPLTPKIISSAASASAKQEIDSGDVKKVDVADVDAKPSVGVVPNATDVDEKDVKNAVEEEPVVDYLRSSNNAEFNVERNASDDVKLAAVSRDAQASFDPIKMDAAIIAAGKPHLAAATESGPEPFIRPSPLTTPSPFPFYPQATGFHYLPAPLCSSISPFQNVATMTLGHEGLPFEGIPNVPGLEYCGPPVLVHPSSASPFPFIPTVPFEMVQMPMRVPLGNTLPLLYPSPAPSPGLLPSLPMTY